MEKIRQILIQWNVAPLMIVGLFCGFAYWILSVLLALPPCTTNENSIAFQGVLVTAFGGITVLISKMYNSMQKNNKGDEDESQ